MWLLLTALLCLFSRINSQTKGTLTPNTLLELPSIVDGSQVSTKITLDANWRWIRNIKDNPQGTSNCYNGQWDASVCKDPVGCTKNCALEGISKEQWSGTYGITTQSNSLTLKYVTQGPYGLNVGSRVYVVAPSGSKYQSFNVLNKQFIMTVDVSQLPCGLNGAVYLAEMPLDGGLNSLNTAGAAFGTGYGDAQCPKDIKYIRGFTNLNGTGACSNEFDLWEANSQSTAFTAHPCKIPSVFPCTHDGDCGEGTKRYEGVCDKDGADFNPFRNNQASLYGPGSSYSVDTTKPFDVITQFITQDHTASGKLVQVKRLYRQNGKTIDGGSLLDSTIRQFKVANGESDHFSTLGGLGTMGESLKRGHVLVLSVWDDSSPAQMRWLDSVYPPTSTKTKDARGRCPKNDNRDVTYLRQRYASASVTFSNIRLEPLSSSAPTPNPPTPTPSVKQWKCQSCVAF